MTNYCVVTFLKSRLGSSENPWSSKCSLSNHHSVKYCCINMILFVGSGLSVRLRFMLQYAAWFTLYIIRYESVGRNDWCISFIQYLIHLFITANSSVSNHNTTISKFLFNLTNKISIYLSRVWLFIGSSMDNNAFAVWRSIQNELFLQLSIKLC